MKRTFAVLMTLIMFGLGCTRLTKGNSGTVTLSFSSTKGLSSLTAGEVLRVVVVNIHMPGNSVPMVKELEFNSSTLVPGQSFEVKIDSIPAGNDYLIQVLNVYESETSGSMSFYYGDATSNVSGPTVVEVTTATVGSSTKMAYINGRYLTATSPDAGPTGTLVAQFKPPGGKPAMNVWKASIINGWFTAFTFDSSTAGFDFVVLESGLKIFSGLNANSAALATTGNHLLKVERPLSFAQDGDGGTRAIPPSDLYLGYFGATSGKTVCYSNSSTIGIPLIYQSYTFGSVLTFNGSGSGVAGQIRPISGGSAQSSSQLYTGTATPCTTAIRDSGAAMWFFQDRVNQGDKEYGGFNPPFMALRPFDFHDGYLTSVYTNTPSSKWILGWKLLPGVADVISGTEIWAKYSSSSGGDDDGGGKEDSCQDLASKGYSLAGTVAAVSGTNLYNFNFTSVSGVALSDSNRYNFRFAACAYKNTSAGKKYLGNYVRQSCLSSNCNATEHFGWGTQNYTLAGNETFTSSNMGGAHARIIGISSANDDYDDLTLSGAGSASNFLPGDEVLLLVSGKASANDCGTFNAEELSPGETSFARVIDGSGTSLKISKGSFVTASGIGTNLSSNTTGVNFCYVQAVRVLHYRTLDLSTYSLAAESFDYAGETGGGIVAIRSVNGISLSAGSTITAVGKGYLGGGSVATHGGGERSDRQSTAPVLSHLGGNHYFDGSYDYAGGGAGYANGGDGNNGDPTNARGGQGILDSFNNGLRFIMGGGGAANTSGFGGNGGGIIFLASKSVSGPGTGTGALDVSGDMASSGVAGGGGGGSLMVFTKALTGNFSVNATGGNAFAPDANGGAGGGSGGYQTIYACDSSQSSTAISTFNGAGINLGAVGGAGNSNSLASASNWWLCQQQ